jgi:hypothetical protein
MITTTPSDPSSQLTNRALLDHRFRRRLGTYLSISALIGVIVSVLTGLVVPGTLGLVSLALGALIGTMIGGGAVLGELLLFRILRPLRAASVRVTRVLGYGLGGALGYAASGLVVVRLLGLVDSWGYGESLLLPTAFFGGFAVLVGLVFQTIEVLRGRLEDSVGRLKAAEFATRELDTARGIQRRLLPPPTSRRPGYSLRALNLPASVVAGDFYDYFELSDGQLAFAVGDVSGKGLGASLIMATVKARLPLVFSAGSLEQTAQRLNEQLSRELQRREFVALLFGRLDLASGMVEWINAGLPDPILIDADRSRSVELASAGDRRPFGLKSTVQAVAVRHQMKPGECLLLYSDGLPESLDERGEPRGYEWLRRQIEASMVEPDPAEALLARVVPEAGARGASVASAGPDDDCTVMWIEWRPEVTAVEPDSRDGAQPLAPGAEG